MSPFVNIEEEPFVNICREGAIQRKRKISKRRGDGGRGGDGTLEVLR